jgi:hypothetical protein
MSNLASAKDDVKAAATCDVCGTPKKPHEGGTSLAAQALGGTCELCYSEVLAEVEKRKDRVRDGEHEILMWANCDEAFDTFLDQTILALFKAWPGLTPTELVDKAQAVWGNASGHDYEEVQEEMTKRARVGEKEKTIFFRFNPWLEPAGFIKFYFSQMPLVPLLRHGRHGLGHVPRVDGPRGVCGEPRPEARVHRRQGGGHVGGPRQPGRRLGYYQEERTWSSKR